MDTEEEFEQKKKEHQREVVKKALAGQPRIYPTPESMQKDVEHYFQDCIDYKEHPSITGLVLALSLKGRQSLYDYDDYGEKYSCIIARAREIVQQSYEHGLWDKISTRGCQFALNAGFGWYQKSESLVKAEVKISLSDEERKLLNKMGAGLVSDDKEG